jgi:hypothetical protein
MNWTEINKIHDDLVATVKAQEGTIWKESASELHSEYNEMPFWILLYEDSDVAAAHKIFKDIVSPYFISISPVNCTVAYTILKEDEEIQVDFLNDNNEIIEAGDTMSLGEFPVSEPRAGDNFFSSNDSKR